MEDFEKTYNENKNYKRTDNRELPQEVQHEKIHKIYNENRSSADRSRLSVRLFYTKSMYDQADADQVMAKGTRTAVRKTADRRLRQEEQ